MFWAVRAWDPYDRQAKSPTRGCAQLWPPGCSRAFVGRVYLADPSPQAQPLDNTSDATSFVYCRYDIQASRVGGLFPLGVRGTTPGNARQLSNPYGAKPTHSMHRYGRDLRPGRTCPALALV